MLSTSKCAQDLTQKYFEMTGKLEPIHVKVDPVRSYAAATSHNKTIYLHPLTMIGPEDLPDELKVSGVDDPKLKTSLYFAKLKSWLSQTFHIPEKNLSSLKSFLDLHLRLWEKPHMIHRIKEFAIAHELGHIFHKHSTKQWDTFFAIILSLFLSFLIVDLVPIFLLGISIFGIVEISKKVAKVLRQYSEQYQEIEADRYALNLTNDLPAAKAFFKGLDAYDKAIFDSIPFLEKAILFIFKPEIFFHISHPSPKNRIAYLKKA